MNQIINNIVNETKTSSVPPRNLTTTNWWYVSSDSEDEETTGAKDTWKQQMLDFYGPVDGLRRISRTPINMKEIQE